MQDISPAALEATLDALPTRDNRRTVGELDIDERRLREELLKQASDVIGELVQDDELDPQEEVRVRFKFSVTSIEQSKR